MSAPSPSDQHVLVVGAGLTGLCAAILLARDGHRVTVLDRDSASAPGSAETAWDGWQRPGVNQFRQLHIMLPRWHQVMAVEIPDVLDVLAALGGRRVNTLHLHPESATAGWRPGDEQFETITGRRPVLETAVAMVGDSTPGLTVRRGVHVTDLLVEVDAAVPRVVGVRTATGEELHAGIIVDAGGRRTPVPELLHRAGSRAPSEERALSGLVYYPRHYRHADWRVPKGMAGALTHHESFSALTLPADSGTWSVAIVASSRDHALRGLRDARTWEAAVRSIPHAAHWIDAEPITDVRPIGGLHDIRRSYVVDDAPIATGLVAVGDAWAATNPSLGRGAAIGLMQACVLRDVLGSADDLSGTELVEMYAAESASRIEPFVASTIGFGRHRLAEMEAEIAGEAYRPDGPEWPATTALMSGARSDPELLRAYCRIGALLGLPQDVLADPDLQARLGPLIGGPRYPFDDCRRADILAAIEGAPLAAVG